MNQSHPRVKLKFDAEHVSPSQTFGALHAAAAVEFSEHFLSGKGG
jgi:hypothetical protein